MKLTKRNSVKIHSTTRNFSLSGHSVTFGAQSLDSIRDGVDEKVTLPRREKGVNPFTEHSETTDYSGASVYSDVYAPSTVTGRDYVDDESLRHTFFIVKGQYRKGVLPSFERTDGETVSVGGYDPERPDTAEWYMVLDNTEFECRACGGTLEKVLKSLRNMVTKYRTRERYYKHLSEATTSDYYDTHYKGRKPLTPEQRAKKAEGRCPRTSPVMRELYNEVMKRYSYYYDSEVQRVIEEAYTDLAERQKNKVRKALKPRKSFSSMKLRKRTPIVKTIDTEELPF